MDATCAASKEAVIDKIIAVKKNHYINEGLVICDISLPDQPLVFVNTAFEKMTGYLQEEVIGKNCRILQRADTLQDEISRIKDAVSRGIFYSGTVRNYTKDGMMFWNKLSLYPYIEVDRPVCHFYIGILRNVSHFIQQDEKIKYLHFHDVNTGLYNYLGFYEISNERIGQFRHQQKHKTHYVCLMVCAVSFVSKNNELPREFEVDRILRHIASEFQLHFFSEDIIAKLNGCRFAFTLFTASDDPSWLYSKMQTIEQRVNAILMYPCKVRLQPCAIFADIRQQIYLDQLIMKAVDAAI